MTLLSLLVAVTLSQLGAADASVAIDLDDAGLPLPPNVSLTSQGATYLGAWTSTAREEAFGNTGPLMPRGGELWANGWRTDSTLQVPGYGALLCPAAVGETFSEPRVAWTGTETLVVWRVTRPGLNGTELRVARVNSSGSPDSCTTLLVPNRGVERSSLQLAAAGAKALALWETPTALEFTQVGSNNIVQLRAKGTTDGRFRPSLTALSGSFQALWLIGPTVYSVPIGPTGNIGQVLPQFPGSTFTHATVTGNLEPLAVLVSGYGTANQASLYLGWPAPDGGAAPSPLLSSAANAPPLAAMGGGTLFVAQETGNLGNGYLLHKGTTAGPQFPLPAGERPEAMATGTSRAGLLSSRAGELQGYALDPAGMTTVSPITPLAVTQRAPPQQHPSAGWVEPSGWLLPWWDPVTPAARARVVQLDGGVQQVTPQSGVGVARMVTATSGLLAGITMSSPTATVLYELSGASFPATGATARLDGPAGYGSAALSTSLAVLWDPKNRSFFVQRGSNQTMRSVSTGVVGRCGAFAGGKLWIPVLAAGGSSNLGLFSFDDSPAAPPAEPTVHALGSVSAPMGEPPCIAASESSLLVAWANVNRQLQLAIVSTSGGSPAISPASPVAMVGPVRNVVVAPIAGGWQVAFEVPGDFTTKVAGVTVSRTGVVGSATPLGLPGGFDERDPWLAGAPNGQALLTWSEFLPQVATTNARHRVLGSPYATAADAGVGDGGVITPKDGGAGDAGIPDAGEPDAGEPDAGEPDAGKPGTATDGGTDLDTPIEFTSCGCGADGASALSLLALAALARRRRS